MVGLIIKCCQTVQEISLQNSEESRSIQVGEIADFLIFSIIDN